MVHLDYRDARPIYIQIVEGYRAQICAGVLQAFAEFLQLFDGTDQNGVCLNIHAGNSGQFINLFFGETGKFFFEFIPVTRKRLVNILDQKKTSRAFALISAEAVKGILVV